MPPFQIEGPWTDETDDVSSSDHSEFEIDSDVSDPEVLEMKRVLEELQPTKIRSNLADATVELQKQNMKLWEQYCGMLRKDPVKVLKKCSFHAFAGYLNWYVKKHPRARRLNAYESIWKGIRQVYYDTTRKVVDPAVGKPVSRYLNGKFCDDHGLTRGMQAKHVIGHKGLRAALYYHWKFDTELFSTERDRVQLAAILLFLAYTGARPGAIVESDCKGIRRTNAALRYRDVKLMLLRPPDGEPLLMMKVTILLDKGKRKRNEPKHMTLYENRACLAMCPVTHFAALAFADNAFHPRLTAAGLTPQAMHVLNSPDARITIEFSFREEILDVPIFRRSERRLEGMFVDPLRATSGDFLSSNTKRLGRRAGFEHPFKPYNLRREVATEVTDHGVSDQQRNQILGHARAETFLKHYMSSHIVVDVQSIFLGRDSMSDVIKEIGKLSLRRDPDLPKRLTAEQKAQAHQHPDIVAAKETREELKRWVLNESGTIRKGQHSSNGIAYKAFQNKVQALQMREERLALDQLLREFHNTADLNHMVAQLEGKEPVTKILTPVQHILPDRNRLADGLFVPATNSMFSDMVEVMSRFCLQYEKRGDRDHGCLESMVDPASDEVLCVGPQQPLPALNGNTQSTGLPGCIDMGEAAQAVSALEAALASEGVKAVAVATEATPAKVTKSRRPPTSLMCLFCYQRCPKVFSRSDALRKHYRMVHFQYQLGAFPCPVLACGQIIHDLSHFANHAVRAHRSNLGLRAPITEVHERSTRPGTLPVFSL